MAGLLPFRLQQGVVTAACIAVCAMFSDSVSAVIISYGNYSIAAGRTGFLDVLVSSDAANATPEYLDSFSAHFQIAPVGTAVPNGLQFSSVQAESQLGNASYVFNGDSLGENGGTPLGAVSTLVNTNDTYIGGDGTLSGNGVALSSSSGSLLLFRLNLDATLANSGDQFTVSLINDGYTQFLDTSFNPVQLSSSSFNSGTFTAVPEPASILVSLLAVLGIAIFRITTRKSVRAHVS